MSILDQINLPPTIKKVDEVKEVPKKNFDIDLNDNVDKRFVVIYSKTPSDEEYDEFHQWGKVMKWGEQMQNVNFDDLEFRYLFIDIRGKPARRALAQHDLSKYNVVLFVSWYEQIEDFIGQVQNKNEKSNVLTSVPKKCISRDQFESALLEEKLISPSLWKSFLKFFFRCLTKQ